MVPQERVGEQDRIALRLRTYAQHILVGIFGVLPLLFIPNVAAPFEYTKVFAVLIAVFLALILFSLSVLRAGSLRIHFSYTIGALWLVALVTVVSALLAGDFTDALIGDLMSIHAAAFVALLALIPSVWVLLKASKTVVMRMYLLFAASTIILVAFHIARIVIGVEPLSLGVFTTNTLTPVGSWNDLALFLGLVVILSLVALEQLSLTRVGKVLFGLVTIAALFMLAVINFFTVWVILGLASLVMVVFTLGRDRSADSQLPLIGTETQKMHAASSLGNALVVFLVSVLFVVGGGTIGGFMSKFTGIEYIEVRPSFEATVNIIGAVYTDNVLLGIGPNKFTDAWREHKDVSINATAFWNTDFNAGSGYIVTFFATTGLLGGVLWLLFLGVYVTHGIRRLLSPSNCSDRVWYFIAVSSFLSAVYVWGVSMIYVPGVVILLIGALQTGVSLYAFAVLNAEEGRLVSVSGNRRARFMLTLATVVIIIGSVAVLYAAGRHYSAIYTFNTSVQAMQAGEPIEMLEGKVAAAFRLFSSDIFARRVAEYQLSKMNILAGLTDPSEAEAQQFSQAVQLGINAAEVAIENDATEPSNWLVLGSIYSVLTSVGVEGAYDRATERFIRAQTLDPKNPQPLLERALVEVRAGNADNARTLIGEAIALKPNFVEAFFLLSQLEIAVGNTEAAIQSTQATIQLEPQNPTRYYQLGILERAQGDAPAAISALEAAVQLEENFANARYHLGLSYDEVGRSNDAKAQFEAVLALNPGNAEVTELIRIIEAEGSLQRLRLPTNQTVNEQTPVTSESGVVNTVGDVDSSLVTPVNTPPRATDSGASGAE